MKRFGMWMLSAVCVFGLSGIAGAADAPKKKMTIEERFAKLDANNDGKVSLDEFKASPKAKSADGAAKRFAAMDTDKDGSLTLEEFKAGMEKALSHKKEGKKDGEKSK